jgi:hypothetical protein
MERRSVWSSARSFRATISYNSINCVIKISRLSGLFLSPDWGR